MAYDTELAQRIRELLTERGVQDLVERRMFGGLAFMVDGRIAVAASREGGVMLRVDPQEAEQLLREPHVRPVQMRGRELAGWLRVDAGGLATREALAPWVERAVRQA